MLDTQIKTSYDCLTKRKEPQMFNRELLVELRGKAGLTQRQLASESGVPHGTLAGIESGHVKVPTTDTMKRIAKVLQVNWPIFFDENDCSNNHPTPAA